MNVERALEWCLAVLGGIFAGIVAHMGGWDVPLEVLVRVMALDFFMGVLRAGAQRNLASYVMGMGVAKKVVYVALVSLAWELSRLTGTTTLRDMVVMAFTLAEGLSIAENAAALGVPLPQVLKDFLAQANPKKFEKPKEQ